MKKKLLNSNKGATIDNGCAFITKSEKTLFKYKLLTFVFFVWLFCFSGATSWAQITVDGNPSDWPAVLNNPANTKKAFRHDAFNMNGVDDQWTGGSQDNDSPPVENWHWVYGNSNDKGDIGNAGAVVIGTKLYFFGDRYAQNGTAEIGFWFFKDDVRPIGDGSNQGAGSSFTGQHTNGDLLVLSNFTQGGHVSVPAVYMWTGKTASSPGGLVLINPADVGASIAISSGVYTAPNGPMFNGENWNYYPKFGDDGTYPVNAFFEGSLDLAKIQGSTGCLQGFLCETRNSHQIFNASLQDLVAGSFTNFETNDHSVTFCNSDQKDTALATYDVNIRGNLPGLIVKWYKEASHTTQVTSTGILPLGDTIFYAVVTDQFGCTANAQLKITINPTPEPKDYAASFCKSDQTDTALATYNGNIGANLPGLIVKWYKEAAHTTLVTNTGILPLGNTIFYAVVTNQYDCTANAQLKITINPNPEPKDYAVSLCKSDQKDTALATYNGNIGANLPGLIVKWYKEAAHTTLVTNTGILPLGNTIFYAVVTNQYDCTANAQLKITINPNPEPKEHNISFCLPDFKDCKLSDFFDKVGVLSGFTASCFKDLDCTDSVTNTGLLGVGTHCFYYKIFNQYGCWAISKLCITINPTPEPKDYAASFCKSDQTDTALATYNGNIGANLPGLIVKWYKEAAHTTLVTNTGILPLGETIFYAVVTNQYDCTANAQLKITINPNPEPKEHNISFCLPDFKDCKLSDFFDKVGVLSGFTASCFKDLDCTDSVTNTGLLGVGTHCFYYKIFNQYGCWAISKLCITINPTPEPKDHAASFCKSDQTDTALATYNGNIGANLPGLVVKWYKEAAHTTLVTNTGILPLGNTIFYAVVTNQYDCTANAQLKITINPNPEPKDYAVSLCKSDQKDTALATYNGNIGANLPGLIVKWYKEAAHTTLVTNTGILPLGNTIFYAVVTNQYDCTANAQLKITINPNPEPKEHNISFCLPDFKDCKLSDFFDKVGVLSGFTASCFKDLDCTDSVTNTGLLGVGTHCFYYKIFNQYGCWAISKLCITINPTPEPKDYAASFCLSDFKDTALATYNGNIGANLPGLIVKWYKEAAHTTLVTNTGILPLGNTIFYAVVTNQYDCTANAQLKITINPNPEPKDYAVSLCKSDQKDTALATYNGNIGANLPGLIVKWYKEAAHTTLVTNTGILPLGNTIFYAVVTNQYDCTANAQLKITINPNPEPKEHNISFCLPDFKDCKLSDFFDKVGVLSGFTASCFKDLDCTDSVTNTGLLGVGTHCFYYKIFNQYGCWAISKLCITINPTPEPKDYAASFCLSDFKDTALATYNGNIGANLPGLIVKWYKEAAHTTLVTNTGILPLGNTIFYAVVTNQYDCTANAQLKITINPNPEPKEHNISFCLPDFKDCKLSDFFDKVGVLSGFTASCFKDLDCTDSVTNTGLLGVGTHCFYYKIFNQYGCWAISKLCITINPTPEPKDYAASFCLSDFKDTALATYNGNIGANLPGLIVKWYKEVAHTTLVTNTGILPLGNTIFYAVVTNQYDCTANAQLKITINPNPEPKDYAVSLCKSDQKDTALATYNGNIGANLPGLIVKWYKEAAHTTLVTNTGILPLGNTIFYAVVTNQYDCTANAQLKITINPNPEPKEHNISFCLPDFKDCKLSDFFDKVGVLSGFTASCFKDLDCTDSVTNTGLLGVGTHCFYYKIFNQYGCWAISKLCITINPTPEPKDYAASFCLSDFKDTALATYNGNIGANLPGLIVKWYKEAAHTTLVTNTGILPLGNTIFYAVVTNQYDCTANAQLKITINPNPEPKDYAVSLCKSDQKDTALATYNGNIGANLPGLIVKWYKEAAHTTLVTNTGILPLGNTIFYAVVTNQYDCTANAQLKITINPNPEPKEHNISFCLPDFKDCKLSDFFDKVGVLSGFTASCFKDLDCTDSVTNTGLLGVGTHCFYYKIFNQYGCWAISKLCITINPTPEPKDYAASFCLSDFKDTALATYNGNIGANLPGLIVKWYKEAAHTTLVTNTGILPLGNTIFYAVVTNQYDCTANAQLKITINPNPEPKDYAVSLCKSDQKDTALATYNGNIGANLPGLIVKWYKEAAHTTLVTNTGILPLGNTIFYAVVTNQYDCTANAQLKITINPNPEPKEHNISFCLPDFKDCKLSDFFDKVGVLSGFTASCFKDLDCTDSVTNTGLLGVGTHCFYYKIFNQYGCWAISKLCITINPTPEPKDYAASFCLSDFKDTALATYNGNIGANLPGLIVKWYKEAAHTTLVTNTGILPLGNTIFYAVVTNQYDCTANAQLKITINPNPEPKDYAVSLCKSDQKDTALATYNGNIGANLPGLIVKWYKEAAHTTLVTNTGILPLGNTIFYAVVTNQYDCTANAQLKITINPNPEPKEHNISFCLPDFKDCKLSDFFDKVGVLSGFTASCFKDLDCTDSVTNTGLLGVGTHCFYYKIFNQYGCWAISKLCITINPTPEPKDYAASFCLSDFKDTALATYNGNIGANLPGLIVKWYKEAAHTTLVTNTGILPLGNTIFYAVVTNQYDCTANAQLKITINPNPEPKDYAVSLCKSDQKDTALATYNGNIGANLPGLIVKWYKEAAHTTLVTNTGILPLGNTIFYAVVTNQYDCTANAQLKITINPNPEPKEHNISFCLPDFKDCKLSDFFDKVGVLSGFTASCFKDLDCTDSVTNTGLLGVGTHCFYYKIFNQYGCWAISKLCITINPTPEPKDYAASFCKSDQTDTALATYNGNIGANLPGLIVKWYKEAAHTTLVTNTGILPLGNTIFYAVVTNQYDCTANAQLKITINPNPEPKDYAVSLCKSDQKDTALATYNGNIGANLPGLIVKWYKEAAHTTLVTNTGILPLGNTIFYAVVTNQYDCTANAQLKITINPNPEPKDAPVEIICNSDQKDTALATYNGNIGANLPGLVVKWYKEAAHTTLVTNTGILPLGNTIFYAVVTNQYGCSANAQLTITINSCTEECTLGYWKNHTNRWCSAYRTCMLFGDVFKDAPTALKNITLLDALNLGGGGDNLLARQGVAALLNACTLKYSDPYGTPQAVIAAVNNAYKTNTAGSMGSILGGLNEKDNCTLGGTRATTASNCATKGKPVAAASAFARSSAMNLVSVYPNPYSQNFKLSLMTSSDEKVRLALYDMTGRLLEQHEINPDEVSELSIGDRFPTGVYNLIVTQGTEVETLRVIKR